jgi:hypothetical protein
MGMKISACARKKTRRRNLSAYGAYGARATQYISTALRNALNLRFGG